MYLRDNSKVLSQWGESEGGLHEIWTGPSKAKASIE